MLDRLKEKLELLGLNLIDSACPHCGTRPKILPAELPFLITCDQCGEKASPSEWMNAKMRPKAFVGDADRVPSGTKITISSEIPSTKIWSIPSSGFSVMALLFALIFIGIAGKLTYSFIFAGGKFSGASGPLLSGMMLIAFSLVGLTALYIFLSGFFLKQRVILQIDHVTLERAMFGFLHRKTLALSEIKSINQTEFYTKGGSGNSNGTPVYRIEITGASKNLKFGSYLSVEEKAWLEADLRRAILPEKYRQNSGKIEKTKNTLAAHPSTPETAEESYLAGYKSNFSIKIPTENYQLIRGISCLVFGLIMLGVNIFILAGDGNPHWGQYVMVILGSVFVITGLKSLLTSFRNAGCEVYLEGSESEVILKTIKTGRVIHEKRFRREAVTDIRTTISGNSNQQIRKRVELIVDKHKIVLLYWYDGMAADEFVAEVRRALFCKASEA